MVELPVSYFFNKKMFFTSILRFTLYKLCTVVYTGWPTEKEAKTFPGTSSTFKKNAQTHQRG